MLGERFRVHRLDERDLDVRVSILGRAREAVRQCLRAAAALAGENDVEAVRGICESGRASADNLADRFLDARDGLLMHPAAPIDDAIDGRSADARAGGHIGDFGSSVEHTGSLRRILM